MKGFVPVTKASLLEMVENCFDQMQSDYHSKRDETVEHYIASEKERITTRKWYRLWMLPKARFSLDDISIEAWANAQPYAMFEASPFLSLDKDLHNSISWVQSLERIANSNYAGEPIQLDMTTFKRISSPELYVWVSAESLFYSVR